MVKKLKTISPKKKLATNKLPKAQTKTQKIKSKKIKAKKAAKENKKIKTKKSPKKKTKEEMDEEELLAELYGPGYDDDYFFYENDLENLPHDEFDIYEIPKTIKENEDYLKKLLEESDIILELLDARDIFYSLDKRIEKQINENKLLIYVINKTDLVSQNYIKKIINHLSKETNKKYPVFLTSCLLREKIKELYDNLKNEASKFKSGIKTPKKKNEFVKIGIVGMPNVGKNSLVQSFELIVESMCEDKFIFFDDNKTFCINSVPATIFGTTENNYLISKKYKNVEDIPNPIVLLNNLFNYVDENKIKDIYGLSKKPENLKNLIVLLKKKFGMKNDKTVQQQILRDIISGKISYEVNI
jgi:GTP-binding protein EngB required for normal cell division